MPVQNASLNATQLAVLQWVNDGCPQGTYGDWSHRVTARALHNRGLILVKGRGASWTATVTDRGAYFLTHGEYPSAAANRGPTLPDNSPTDHSTVLPEETTQKRSLASGRPPDAPPKGGRTPKPGVVDRLMLSLQAASGHRILVPASEQARYRRLAVSAKRLGRLPAGMQLSFDYVQRDSGYLMAIALAPLPEWQTRLLDPEDEPETLQHPTDVVQALMESETFPVHGEPRTRAFCLIDALVIGARGSGLTVSAQLGQHARHSTYTNRVRGQDEVRFMAGRDNFIVRLTQAMLQRPHKPTERELARARRGYMFPDFDEVPDKHLGLVLEGPGGRFWADSWRDTEEHRLEDDLSQVLEEMRLRHGHLAEQRAAELERQRQAQRERAEREQRAAAARERAALAHREHLIDTEARNQAKRWNEANEMRAYASAVRRQASTLPAVAQADGLRWADRIAAVADTLDPLPGGVAYPDVATTPTAADLKPFMNL
ncbi:hypothetical protein [Amycolatopsis sp. NPDC006125]|uniref:hypothetical protein n=1 Tax=Amycolatopsis sp. NPDC006125 TaxID=3156730 RepID=UPI0033A6FF62